MKKLKELPWRPALALLAAAAACWLTVWVPYSSGAAVINYSRLNYGSSLLAGVLNQNITWMMPLFETVFSAALNAGAGPLALLLAARLAAYLLVFAAGCRLRGYWAGLAALALSAALEAAGPLRFDDEQAFYALFLLLVLNLLLRARNGGLKGAVLAGLAVGSSLLVRTPLILFPPVAALPDLLRSRGGRRAALLRALALAGACYVLLVPWGLLNRSVSGRFELGDGRRAACNLITGALGSVYTMEGDCRALAGLDEKASPLGFYARSALKAPAHFIVGVAVRLWHIFLFYPALFGLFLLAAAFGRRRLPAEALTLPAYFLLAHAAMSVEERYFYPMLFLLPPLIAAGLLPRGGEEGCPLAEKGTTALFWAVLCAVLAVEGLTAAYPARAARHLEDAAYLRELPGRFPRDRVFGQLRCRLLWLDGDDAAYAACVEGYGRRFDDPVTAYFLEVSASTAPASVPPPANRRMEAAILLMLRQAELGGADAARAARAEAYLYFEAFHNMLRGEPYARDRELARLARGHAAPFWDEYVYEGLLLFGPGRLAGLLPRLETFLEPPEGSRPFAMAELASLGPAGMGMLRRRVAADSAGLPAGRQCLLWRKEAAEAKALSDRAVERIRARDLAGARRLLTEAAGLDPASPEAWMNLCAVEQRRGDRAAAGEACRAAAYAVYFNPENRLPQLEALAAEAAREGARLLKAAGRGREARGLLRAAAENARLKP